MKPIEEVQAITESALDKLIHDEIFDVEKSILLNAKNGYKFFNYNSQRIEVQEAVKMHFNGLGYKIQEVDAFNTRIHWSWTN